MQPSPTSPTLGFQRRRVPGITVALTLALALAVCAAVAVASSGDRAYEYIHCVNECDTNVCQTDDLSHLSPQQLQQHDLSLPLKMLHWTCLDNCRYVCMHDITEGALDQGLPVHQYHGKWPFHRLFGMQEPASVFFSLLNGYMHLLAWPKVKSLIPENYYLRPYYLGYALVGMNTWLWSAVYHTRDWPSTEKLDYFSAGTSIMFGFFYTVIRITRMVNRRSQFIWGVVCLVPLLLHISYLAFIHFDYGYNMAATATVGVIHNLWWLGWSFANRKERPYAWEPTLGVMLVTAAMCLEILDFPPLWGIFDAHSLWHAATIPMIPLWYRFLLKDTEWEVRHMKGVLRSSYKD